MAKNRRNVRVVYPEERESKRKDANKKLRSEIKSLKKKIDILEKENKTLQRSFDKSCQYIDHKSKGKSLEEVVEDIKKFDYKETERGRAREKKKRENYVSPSCSKCGTIENEGYTIMDFVKFKIESCQCGHRRKVALDEGNERS